MKALGIDAKVSSTLTEAFHLANVDSSSSNEPSALVCGSLFLVGEALVALNAYPWSKPRFDLSESLNKL